MYTRTQLHKLSEVEKLSIIAPYIYDARYTMPIILSTTILSDRIKVL